ncbi:hypothetical protein [Parabacteroides faecis]|uniref:DUF2271 domain-containing protein n=1 Tax=Parabacteroides faecis TaxID=1217282 RepID=A0ABR6KUD3_9BACT|nr:hypothetical protein [Parabacteroides faecis]MBB4625087.1 hypothetical protein [Parabacteroides faecis]MCS2894230.1 DUF2271 domain-containing protein [Parabacteroides faecis]UVQ47181.1 DUF2271 domain-containing protein [Parabacteroides faecis]GGK16614.1 hypothetical protein GCM10007084_44830 [Parabacteroides faecis]
MNKTSIFAGACMVLLACCSCNNDLVEYKKNDLKITLEKGESWLHDFPLFLGINKKNPPQIAIWLEDRDGNYLSTVYVTHKIATQSWQMAGKNRRKESLPHWSYSRGVKYDDGLYLPTKKEPFTDGLTGATPHDGFDVKMQPAEGLKQFRVKIEINHSTDFNDNYPKSAQEGDKNYSGGKEGSGQPAVIYAADIDLSSDATSYVATLVGHSSPDGSDGQIYPDTSSLTSALQIVKQITITIQP